jgi:hypothetical protein
MPERPPPAPDDAVNPRRAAGWWRRTVALLLAATLAVTATAQEVQQHGLVFEQWVRDTFFDGYRPAGYTQKWDIPAAANRAHGGVPANPKAIKYGTAVDLGDALRQFAIDEPFLLILGFWQQRGDEKHFVNLIAPLVTPEQWRALWHPITLEDLRRLDALIKDTSRPLAETRRLAREMKASPPFSEAVMQVNPKVGTGQRRLQCSLRFKDVFAHLAPDTDPRAQESPALWGVPYPGAVASKPRTFRAK